MSLWDKWEKEKLEKQGIKVEYESDVKIQDTREKPNLRKQTLIVGGAFAGCVIAVYILLGVTGMLGNYWSDTYFVRMISENHILRQFYNR
jgi:hypothetical protein